MPQRYNTVFYFIDNVHSPFVLNDIGELAKRFAKIVLFSMDAVEEGLVLPANVVVYQNYLNWKQVNIRRVIGTNLLSLVPAYLSECMRLRSVLPVKTALALLASNLYKAAVIESIIKKDKHAAEQAVFYSFWFYDCIFMAWLVKKGIAKKAITRAHGGDLFEERLSLKGKVLFRHFQLKQLSSIYSISNTGKEYLQKKYPAYAGKIKVARLGTHAELPADRLDAVAESPALNLLSCGNIVNGKRLYLIADALLECKSPVNWTHFGRLYEDETSARFFSAVEHLKTKPHIQAHVKGSVPHSEIMSFYKNNRVDLFISLSEAEGIPVTMMEAGSFGVPVLATDVGGCREIVNEHTGLLVDKDIAVAQVAQILDQFKISAKNTGTFRKGIRVFWEKNFDSKINYDRFYESLIHN